nr:MAG TPA: hypothetical protein [Caudoviricetes sp.]
MESNESGVKVPKGQINYNTVAGSLGLAAFAGLGLRGAQNGGLFGAVAGAGTGSDAGSRPVTQAELAYAQALDASQSEVARLQSEKYTDNHIVGAFKETTALFRASDQKIADVVKDVTSAFIETGKSVAVLNTEVSCLKEQISAMKSCYDQKLEYEIRALNNQISGVANAANSAIAMEAERRSCADNTIVNYVNATFYPKQVADVTTGTTTTASSTYNPLACYCGK